MKELLFSLQTHNYEDHIEHSPSGWDITKIIPKQAETYHGIFQGNTMPLKFFFEGATILRNEFYTWGQNAYCHVLVDKLDKATNKYFRAYTCKVDFSTFKDKDNHVGASIADVCLVETNDEERVRL